MERTVSDDSFFDEIVRVARKEKLKEASKRARELYLSTTQIGCQCCGAGVPRQQEATLGGFIED
jgi:hypothetical protein